MGDIIRIPWTHHRSHFVSTTLIPLDPPGSLGSPRSKWYTHAHAKEMPIKSIARLIQTMLYARRMFPYYVYNVLSGIEEDGTGAVYSFDPVGSYERETCRAAGAAQSLLQPFLDNQVGALVLKSGWVRG